MKRFFASSKFIWSSVAVFLLAIGLAAPLAPALAQEIMPGINVADVHDENAFRVATEEGEDIIAICPTIAMTTPATSADVGALITCVTQAAKSQNQTVNKDTMKQLKALEKKQAREEWLKKMEKELMKNLAGAFKSSLSLFTKQLAKDTATWIASGGKGQQPLFVTEGWGSYLQNAADSALGDFLDQIGQRYGVDLCQPDFKIKIAIHTAINWQKPRKVRCTFTKMMTNWNKAMSSNLFVFEYTNSLQPGENDVSVFLTLQSDSFSAVSKKVKAAEDEAMANNGWKSVKDFAGKILTPGTAIRKAHEHSMDEAGKQDGIFTGTIWDFVETFLNTLVAQLLQNLANGLVSSGGSSGSSTGNSSGSGLNALGLSSLYNRNAGPQNPGVAGAEERANAFVETKSSEAGAYDVLIKLIQCTDKANPGPTDCVIDQKFLSAIKDKKQVIDLPDDIKSRFFSPQINQSNSLESEIPWRSIIIMRKYRIVPIGWELASNIIRARKDRNYTLSDVMDGFTRAGADGQCGTNDDGESVFCGLVDPYWVLKVPELYCRRQGFGGHDSSQSSQDGSVSRDEYCADEQQCIKENTDGSCKAYGYCTEERRQWNFGQNSSCDPKYNTCQVFTNTNANDAKDQALLANTLDFRYCNQSNAGCRWYSQSFNTVSSIWSNYNPDHSFNICGSITVCPVQLSGTVQAWHSISADQIIRLSSPCTADTCRGITGCTFTGTACVFSGTGNSCDVPRGGSSCRLDLCVPPASLLSGLNNSFEDAGSKGAWDAAHWNLTFSYINSNNREFRDKGGRTGNYALRLLTNYQTNDLTASIDNIAVSSSAKYNLKFFAKGQMNNGSIMVGADVGTLKSQILNQGSVTSDWQEFTVPFDTQGNTTTTIKVIVSAGTWSNVYLDDFSLTKSDDNCVPRNITLTLGEVIQTNKSMYFDRDAQACTSDAAGCSEFIRTKAGLGSNLIISGDFEDGAVNSQWVNDTGVAFVPSEFSIPVHSGNNYLKFNATVGNPEARSTVANSVVAGKKYVLSVWALANGDVSTTNFNLGLVNGSNIAMYLDKEPIRVVNQWTRMKVAFVASTTANLYPFISKDSDSHMANVYFDDIKLEAVNYNVNDPTDYSGYKPSERPDTQLSYLKLAPAYYNCYGTTTPAGVISWPQTEGDLLDVLARQNSACENYAPVCIPQEVDCELYTPFNGDPAVPGVAQAADVCPSECAGYQVYKQEETNFVADKYRQFIANDRAQYCSASYAGCDEFTNLDKLGQGGGEKKEYYTFIKACQKPGLDDSPYYTWEGSDVTGYQLKVFRLKTSQSTSSDIAAPCTNLTYNASGQGVCNDLGNSDPRYDSPSPLYTPTFLWAGSLTTFIQKTSDDVWHLGIDLLNEPVINELHKYGICAKQEINGFSSGTIDILPNSDCRQFYDDSGNIHYRLLSKTATASEDCHPYRRTMTQLTSAEAQSDCLAKNGFWNTNGECIYMGTPGSDESRTCPASAVGCRQYTGNRGNNIKKVLESYFNAGDASSTDGWTDGDGAMNNVLVSMDSTHPGGYSMQNSGTGLKIQHNVPINPHKDYTLSFWAKGSGTLKVYVSSSPVSLDFTHVTSTVNGAKMTSTPVLTSSWQRYELGPVFTDINPDSANNQLVFEISGGGLVNLDSVVLKEMNQSTFVVENSWFTPVSCDNKLDDPSGSKAQSAGTCTDDNGRCSYGEMLGCNKYKDRSNQIFYLKSFASLCREKAAGCEALINTHNSDSPYAQSYNVGDPSAVDVPADDMAYLVNDSKYSCLASDKGCTAYGLPQISSYDEVLGYANTYIKNQPDNYGNSLCHSNEVWCDEYKGFDALFYFKNPRNKVCEFRSKTGDASVGAWYQQSTDQPCSTTYDQTFGYSTDKPADKEQPLGIWKNALGVLSSATGNAYQGWAGACPVAQNTCSEYLDPRADIYTNYFRINNYVSRAAGWTSNPPEVFESDYYRINLKSHVLYSLSTNVVLGRVGVALICDKDAVIYSPDNSMASNYTTWYWVGGMTGASGRNTIMLIKTGLSGQKEATGRFYVDSDASLVHCRITRNSDTDVASIRIVPAGTYYTLTSKVDKTSCNGLVDFRTGCVLFNDRSNINYQEMSATNAIDKYTGYLSFNADKTYYSNMLNGQPQKVAPVSAAGFNDSNIIIKVQPDRTCQNWLYCNTYQKVGDEKTYQFKNQDLCLGISGCSEINPKNGDCIQFEVPPRQILSTSSPAVGYAGIQNLDGYSVPLSYPASQMNETGETANVINGNFESVYKNGKEPVGWYLPDGVKYDGDLENKNNDQENTYWEERKFSVESTVKNRKEGVGYLRLNSAYMADSEQIDVFGGTSYTITAWVNTLGLMPSGARSMILIRDPRDYSCPPGATDCTTIALGAQTWQVWDGLSVSSSMPWTKLQHVIRVKPGSNRIRVRLINYITAADYIGCHDGRSGGCAIGGNAYFDDINIKPSLNVRPNTFVESSCRLYPSMDSPSCKYNENGTNYYGWYGYCLSKDPQNENICLQWWPVDSIKGDMLDEVSAYTNRSPLYYCLVSYFESKLHTLSTLPLHVTEGTGGEISAGWTGNCSEAKAEDLKSTAPDDDLTNASQYNIVAVNLTENYGGGGGAHCAGEGTHSFEKVSISANGQLRKIYENIFGLGSTLTAGETLGYISDGSDDSDSTFCAGFIFFYDKDENNHYKGDVKSFKACAGDQGSFSHVDTHDFKFQVKYMTSKIGACQAVVETVLPAGSNKAWSKRISQGSMFRFSDIGTIYNTDYGPYGSMVVPDKINYPSTWDSDPTAKGRQPIYSQPPLMASYQKPYQARAGEVYGCLAHKTPGGDNIFDFLLSLISVIDDATSCYSGCFSGIMDLQELITMISQQDWIKIVEKIPNIITAVNCVTTRCDDKCNRIGHCTVSGSICVKDPGVPDEVASRQCPISGELCLTSIATKHKDDGVNFPTVLAVAKNRLKRIFAKSYGLWQWDTSSAAKGYVKMSDSQDWDVPTTMCINNHRNNGAKLIPDPSLASPPAECATDPSQCVPVDFCAVAPVVKNVRVNGRASDASIPVVRLRNDGNGILEFNALVNPDQMPLSGYRINWGDANLTSYAGIKLRDRSNSQNKFRLAHYYDYEHLKTLRESDPTHANYGIYCDGDAVTLPDGTASTTSDHECWIHINIQIRDNWGWCNSQTSTYGFYIGNSTAAGGAPEGVYDCDSTKAWKSFVPWVVVKEGFYDAQFGYDDSSGEEDYEDYTGTDSTDCASLFGDGICQAECGENASSAPYDCASLRYGDVVALKALNTYKYVGPKDGYLQAYSDIPVPMQLYGIDGGAEGDVVVYNDHIGLSEPGRQDLSFYPDYNTASDPSFISISAPWFVREGSGAEEGFYIYNVLGSVTDAGGIRQDHIESGWTVSLSTSNSLTDGAPCTGTDCCTVAAPSGCCKPRFAETVTGGLFGINEGQIWMHHGLTHESGVWPLNDCQDSPLEDKNQYVIIRLASWEQMSQCNAPRHWDFITHACVNDALGCPVDYYWDEAAGRCQQCNGGPDPACNAVTGRSHFFLKTQDKYKLNYLSMTDRDGGKVNGNVSVGGGNETFKFTPIDLTGGGSGQIPGYSRPFQYGDKVELSSMRCVLNGAGLSRCSSFLTCDNFDGGCGGADGSTPQQYVLNGGPAGTTINFGNDIVLDMINNTDGKTYRPGYLLTDDTGYCNGIHGNSSDERCCKLGDNESCKFRELCDGCFIAWNTVEFSNTEKWGTYYKIEKSTY